MEGGRSGAVLRQVRRLFESGTVAGLSEGQLLERFVARRDESAFEALVARHGPMVLGVCRRLLRDPHDIEDAFQATFLVLARKADSIRNPERLGPWLYRVTRRVADRARIAESRRRACERRAAPAEAVAPEPSDRDEFRPLLYEEVDRLPESYRAAIVLCYLQGQTHEEAARRLAWPVGTVRGRLARARALLRERLVRRGVALSAALAIDAALEGTSEAAVPPKLSAAAIGAAVRSTGRSLAGDASASAVALARGVLKAMFLTKMKLAAAAGVLAVGVGLLAPWASGSSPRAPGDDDQPAPRSSVDPPAEFSRQIQEKRVEPPAPDRDLAALQERVERLQRRIHEDQAELRAYQEELHRLQDLKNRQAALKQGEGSTPAGPLPRERQMVAMPEYVVEPPDLLEVDVLQALPGRGIGGERLVRPDGTISLGYYGDVYVAGLTLSEIKEKVILHLRKFLKDEVLGLVELHPATDEDGKPVLDEAGQPKATYKKIDPKDSDRVFVDVAAWNSKFYYVEGDVGMTGRFPITGNETVLDAIHHAGGLAPTADAGRIHLIRRPPPGVDQKPQVLPVNFDAITREGDPTTNYQLMPGDRVYVYRRPDAAPKPGAPKATTEERLTNLEQKMDQVLQELRSQRREPER